MKEYKDVANINFRFKEKSYPCDYVSGLAQILYDYPIEDILIVEHLFLLWKPDLIKCIMEFLKPENVRIHIVGKLFENITDETEKWYGVKFKKEKISPDIINKWINAGLNADLKLPPKNEFIPEKFDIKPIGDKVNKFIYFFLCIFICIYIKSFVFIIYRHPNFQLLLKILR